VFSTGTNRAGTRPVRLQSIGDERHAVAFRTLDGLRVVGCDRVDSAVDDCVSQRLRNLALTERALDDARSQSVPVDAVAAGHSWRWDVELGPSSSSMPPSWANA